MNAEELSNRLKQFAYRVVNVTKVLPSNPVANIIKNQVLGAAFSAAANYRSACKAYTKKSFSAKLGISFEELDETVFIDLNLIGRQKLGVLMKEGEELCKILAKSIMTSRDSKKFEIQNLKF